MRSFSTAGISTVIRVAPTAATRQPHDDPAPNLRPRGPKGVVVNYEESDGQLIDAAVVDTTVDAVVQQWMTNPH